MDGSDQRLYYTNDANMNVTALVNPSGQVVERYAYDPYGRLFVLNGASDADGAVTEWSADADNTSDWGNEILYCGYRLDPETRLYHVRHRYLHPMLGRWMTRDPLGHKDGMSAYQYVRGRPGVHRDPRGLAAEMSDTWRMSLWEADLADHDHLVAYELFVRVRCTRCANGPRCWVPEVVHAEPSWRRIDSAGGGYGLMDDVGHRVTLLPRINLAGTRQVHVLWEGTAAEGDLEWITEGVSYVLGGVGGAVGGVVGGKVGLVVGTVLCPVAGTVAGGAAGAKYGVGAGTVVGGYVGYQVGQWIGAGSGYGGAFQHHSFYSCSDDGNVRRTYYFDTSTSGDDELYWKEN